MNSRLSKDDALYIEYADAIQAMREILFADEIEEAQAVEEAPDVRIDEGAELTIFIDNPEAIEALKELAFLAGKAIISPPPSGCTREEWREAARLDAQKAAARANAYGRRLTAEKAREIRRRRKWKKSIDARVLMSGFSG